MGSKKQAPAFAKGMNVVYPAHGVGRVADIETQEIAGMSLELLVVTIERSRMVLRIPKAKVASSGLRPVIDAEHAARVLASLEGKARRSRVMWSRRAQDYEAKINSGDVMSLAEVVRDLSRVGDEQASYSEKTIYENALDRLTQEIAISLGLTETEATSRIASHLSKRPARPSASQDDAAEMDAEAA